VIQGRLNTLNRIKDDVDQVIAQLQSGALTPETVPIFSSDIERALPLLGKPSDPLPQVLRQTGLPPAIANLFPGGMSPKDTEQALQINNIMKGYMNNLFEGTSWGVNLSLKYDNPNVLKLQAEAAKGGPALDTEPQEYPLTPGLPSSQPIQTNMKVVGQNPTAALVSRVADATLDRTSTGYEAGLPGSSMSRMLPEVKVGDLDWKQRSQQIKEQIRRRGMNPMDFGAMPDDVVVSNEFSWKGYTQMMCSRLNSTTDPGLPTTVGCPPQNWQGWRQ
jgi:hypothetical protein